METKGGGIIMQNKVFVYLAIATGLILLVPLLSRWPWTISDFAVMGALLLGTGFLFVQTARVTPRKYRILIGFAFLAALLYFWAELAVGVFTNLGS